MKRLIVDMDDVITDATGQFITFYEREFGIRVSREHLGYKDEGEGFPDHHDIVKQFPFRPDFFRSMVANEGSKEVLVELNKKYNLFIVSAAMEFPLSLAEKLAWLNEHCPFLTWKQVVFCGSKSIVHGDYMIDDLPYNLEGFQGERYIFSAPHNLHITGFQRLNSWREIGDKFL